MRATVRQLGEIRDGINTAHFVIMLEADGEADVARYYARVMVPRMPRLTQRAYSRTHQHHRDKTIEALKRA